jgi:ribosome-associated toxin RatA of RatAB toxin-antitoxin module
MANHRFSASVRIAAEPQTVFDWVADYRHVAQVLEGVNRWEPLQHQTRGRGARFSVSMSALGFPLDNVLFLDVWEEPRAIGWRSESGLIEQTGRWDFVPRQEGTEVSLTISYVPPLGLVGQLVAGEVDALVRARLERALAAIKGELEGEGGLQMPG